MSNGDNESVEMDVINNKSAQSPSSKDNSIKQKLTRLVFRIKSEIFIC